MNDEEKVVQLFEGDPLLDSIVHDIKEIIYERAGGVLPIASVLGILEIVKIQLLEERHDED